MKPCLCFGFTPSDSVPSRIALRWVVFSLPKFHLFLHAHSHLLIPPRACPRFSRLYNSTFNSEKDKSNHHQAGCGGAVFSLDLTSPPGTVQSITCLAGVQMFEFPTSSPCYFLSHFPQVFQTLHPSPAQKMNSRFPYPMK